MQYFIQLSIFEWIYRNGMKTIPRFVLLIWHIRCALPLSAITPYGSFMRILAIPYRIYRALRLQSVHKCRIKFPRTNLMNTRNVPITSFELLKEPPATQKRLVSQLVSENFMRNIRPSLKLAPRNAGKSDFWRSVGSKKMETKSSNSHPTCYQRRDQTASFAGWACQGRFGSHFLIRMPTHIDERAEALYVHINASDR